MEDEFDGKGIIPFLFACPGKSSSSSSEWISIEVAGRDFGMDNGRLDVDWLKAIDVCGRPP